MPPEKPTKVRHGFTTPNSQAKATRVAVHGGLILQENDSPPEILWENDPRITILSSLSKLPGQMTISEYLIFRLVCQEYGDFRLFIVLFPVSFVFGF